MNALRTSIFILSILFDRRYLNIQFSFATVLCTKFNQQRDSRRKNNHRIKCIFLFFTNHSMGLFPLRDILMKFFFSFLCSYGMVMNVTSICMFSAVVTANEIKIFYSFCWSDEAIAEKIDIFTHFVYKWKSGKWEMKCANDTRAVESADFFLCKTSWSLMCRNH